MEIEKFYSTEEEEGIQFEVVRVNIKGFNITEANAYAKPGYCKVILNIDGTITRTHYFNNGVETSKEKILQDERIKSLRR